MATIEIDLDGYTDLPAGLIANIVTYFEMRSPPADLKADIAVRRVLKTDLLSYRRLYSRIGQDWLWFSRAVMPDATLAELLGRQTTEIYFLEVNGEPVGLAELHRDEPNRFDVEIGMFGVVPEATGTGASYRLMQTALVAAWQGGTTRVWLHTCSFDHPAAVHFYTKCGFVPFKFAIEVSPDPRLQGFLPRDAARHVALIDHAAHQDREAPAGQ